MSDTHDHDNHHSHLPADPELRVKALETLLVEKGLIDPAAIDVIIETYQHKVGPRNGAAVVAKAWCDAQFKAHLLQNGDAAVSEMGFGGRQGEHIVVVENTPSVHHMVVCTLCSCYPWPLLGVPPAWYKSDAYRARAVRDPRGVLLEFGVHIPKSTEIRVLDSTAEIRYLVLPQRPAGSENLSQNQLAPLVTRNAMIGTGVVEMPATP